MTYKAILEYLKAWIEASTLNGVKPWIEVLLEMEIELNPRTSFPAVFICPIPFEMSAYNQNKYAFRIYVVDDTTPSPNYVGLTGTTLTNRINVFNDVIVYAESFIRALPDDIFEDYPITFTPIVLWDNTCDGVYFDINVKSNIACAEIINSGITGITNYLITNGTSGSSGSSGVNGTDGTGVYKYIYGTDYTGLTTDTYLIVPANYSGGLATNIYLPKASGTGKLLTVINNNEFYTKVWTVEGTFDDEWLGTIYDNLDLYTTATYINTDNSWYIVSKTMNNF